MPMRHNLGTFAGLVSFFDDRLQRREWRAARRAAAGKTHPLDRAMIANAREDLQEVRALVVAMERRSQPRDEGTLQRGNTDLVPAQNQTLGEQA